MIDYQEDSELLHRLSNNDQLAFKKIFKKYYNFLRLLAYNNLQNKEDAEDLVQEIFMDLWQKRLIATAIQTLKPYLIGMCKLMVWARNKAQTQTKTSSLDNMSHDAASQALGTSTDDTVMERELEYQGRLYQFYNSLNQCCGKKGVRVYIKIKLYGYPLEEVARSEDITINTVNKHLANVTKHLKEQCQKQQCQ